MNMMWTEGARERLLGTEEAFRNDYCSKLTDERLGDVPRNVARMVIRRFAEILPEAAHSTVRWNASPQAVIVSGRMNAAGRIISHKICLFALERQLYLCAAESDLEVYPVAGFFPEGWEKWRPQSGLCRYLTPLSHLPGALADDNGHVHKFLVWMRQRHAAVMTVPDSAYEAMADILREEAGAGETERADSFAVVDAVYPRLMDKVFGTGTPVRLRPGASGTNNTARDMTPQPAAAGSDIATHDFSAGQLIQTVTVNRPCCGVSFLNVNFRLRADISEEMLPRLHGPGIYGLFFKPPPERQLTGIHLVYLGIYRGQRENPFSGNVAEMRWRKHIAACTMRGNRVSIRPTPLQELSSVVGKDHDFRELLLEERREDLGKDRGCQAAFNRARFAFEYWDVFNPRKTDLLSHFEIRYVQLGASMWPAATVRKTIVNAEKRLIKLLQPACNHETEWKTRRTGVTPSDFVDAVTKVLGLN